MRIPRLYLPQPLKSDSLVGLDEEAANYLARVLRLGPGAPLTVFNGQGGEYQAALVRVERRSAEIAVGAYAAREAESPLPVIVAQGISRGERMDYTIQKAVELGATGIVPLLTERSVVNLQGERLERRLRHWQGVACSACEQCGRNQVPAIAEALRLDDWLARDDASLRLLLHPEGGASLTELARPAGAISLLIGPEGGLSPGEIGRAREAGYTGVRLGPRILRTETAALVALTALQTLWGDLAHP